MMSNKDLANNPLAEVEKSIAFAIKSNPLISGVFKTKKVEVFCVSCESAKTLIERKVYGGLGLCVFINAGTITEVSGKMAIVEIEVSVRAPDIVSEPYIATSEIASSLIDLLHGTNWTEPFCKDIPLLLRSMSSTNETGAVIRDLTFQAQIHLKY